jgi:hypothetical protein
MHQRSRRNQSIVVSNRYRNVQFGATQGNFTING